MTAPKTKKERLRAIREEASKLDHTEENFTADGKPDCRVLSERLGWQVKAKERDEAMEQADEPAAEDPAPEQPEAEQVSAYRLPVGFSEAGLNAFLERAEDLDRGTTRHPWPDSVRTDVRQAIEGQMNLCEVKRIINETVVAKLGPGPTGAGPFAAGRDVVI